jgi:hypothetical protein
MKSGAIRYCMVRRIAVANLGPPHAGGLAYFPYYGQRGNDGGVSASPEYWPRKAGWVTHLLVRGTVDGIG